MQDDLLGLSLHYSNSRQLWLGKKLNWSPSWPRALQNNVLVLFFIFFGWIPKYSRLWGAVVFFPHVGPKVFHSVSFFYSEVENPTFGKLLRGSDRHRICNYKRQTCSIFIIAIPPFFAEWGSGSKAKNTVNNNRGWTISESGSESSSVQNCDLMTTTTIVIVGGILLEPLTNRPEFSQSEGFLMDRSHWMFGCNWSSNCSCHQAMNFDSFQRISPFVSANWEDAAISATQLCANSCLRYQKTKQKKLTSHKNDSPKQTCTTVYKWINTSTNIKIKADNCK